MPDKKYLIEIPGMPEGSGVWDSDKWERNKDAFMSDYPEANVFELGEYDAEDTNENDQIMLTFENDPDSSGVWDAAKWERNKEAFTADHPEAKVNRVRYVDYWGNAAQENRVKREELSQPDAERDARLADLGYYDDMSGQQKNFSLENNTIGLKPVSSAIEQNSVSGETTYHDPKLAEFYANDSAHTERMAEIARLDAEYDSNPSVVAQREWEEERRQNASRILREAEESYKNLDHVAVSRYHRAFEGSPTSPKTIAKGMEDAAKDDEIAMAFTMLKEAETLRSGIGEGALKGFGKNLILPSTLDGEDYQRGQQALVKTFMKLQEAMGPIDQWSEEKMKELLTKEEMLMVEAFFELSSAQSDTEGKLSTGYEAGRAFAHSVPFMVQFMMSAGMSDMAAKPLAQGLTKMAAKTFAKKAGSSLVKRAVNTGLRQASRLGIGVAQAAAAGAVQTMTQSGTTSGVLDAMMQFDEDGYMNADAQTVATAYFDRYIENFSEGMGEVLGGIVGTPLKGAGRALNKAFKTTAFTKLGSAFGKTTVGKLGKAAGVQNGLFEMAEEAIGAAIRDITINEGAWEEFSDSENLLVTALSFLPTTVFGGAMSLGQIGAAKLSLERSQDKMRKRLAGYVTPEQMEYIINTARSTSAESLVETMKPVLVGMQLNGASAEQINAVRDYMVSAARYQTMMGAEETKAEEQRNATREKLEQEYGKFYHAPVVQNKAGEQMELSPVVRIARLKNGQDVYIVSNTNDKGEFLTIDMNTKKKGMAKESDIAEQIDNNGKSQKLTMTESLNDFLSRRVMLETKETEAARMKREYQEQIDVIRSEIQEGTKINLGTEGSPVILVATGKTSNAGVEAIDQNGVTHTIGWEQTADAMQKPIKVLTDSQIVEQEIAEIVARDAERKAQRAQQKGANAVAANEAVAEASETTNAVAQETKHIPLNEDGTVNEAAFWEQDPEGYAQWNDEQNQDGGADTIQQIEAAKAELTAMLNEAQRATLTSNPANRKAAKREVSRLAERLARLEALEQSYADRALDPLRERAKMWADLTGAQVHVLETEEELAAISATAASENAKRGSRVRGFAKDGRAYIFLPGIKDIKEIDEVFFHEAVAHNGLKGLLGKENYDKLCEQVWNMMSQAARNQFIRYPGVNGDYLAAADEYIAHIAEKMGAGIAEAEEKTIWQKIVAFVRDVLRAMGMEIKLTEQELSDLLHQAYADLANNMAKAEQIASGEAMSAVEEAPSEARQQYDALLADLTPEEIEAVAENDFNAAQEAYNAHLANAPKVEPGESSKAYIERKKAYNDELKRLEAELNAQQALMDEIAKAKQTETEEETIEPVEDLDQVQQEDGTFRLSVVTYNDWTDNLGNQHKGTRTMVLERMVAMNFTDAEINDMMRKMDTAYEYMEKLRSLTNEDGSVRFDEFNEWAKATPMYKQVGRDFVKAITSLVSNGDYPINMELTTDCIKREAYTMLLNTLIKRGADLSAMGPGEIVTIQKMMKQYGIETACALCFVEGKRLQIVNWASQIVEDWNAALVEAGVETEEHFGFGKDGDAFIPAEEWRTHENKAEVAKVMKQLDEIDLLFRGIDPVQFKKQKAKNKKAVEKYKKEKAEAWAKRAKRSLSEWKPTDKQEAEIKKMAKEGLAPTYVNENMEEYRNAFNAMRNEWLEKHPGKDPLSFTPTKKQWEALGKIRNRQIDTVKAKMVRLIMEYPEMRKKMTLNDLLGSKGLMEIRQQHGQAYADLYSIILQRFGTGTPKPVQDAVPYDGELMTLSESAFKKANEIGGARLFSFSDFDITKVFDYMQMFFDLEANRQMLQSYTKEVAAVIIFGRSNAKFNISTLANAYVPQEVLDEYAKAGEAKQKEMRHKWAENAGLQVDEAGNITGINFSEEHSVSPAFAQQIFHDDARNKDCGAIMVGASVNHAIYSAAQAWIRMVIPFHLSGMPKAAQDKTDVKWYFDNTPFQSTRKKTKEGWSKIESSEDTFKLYDDMSAPGWNMRDKAKQYLAWCAEKGFRPKFDWGINSDYYRAYCEEYGYTPNQQIIDIMDADTTDGVWNQYYKFLTDFTAYKPVFNEQGEMIDESPSPQLPVVANFDFSELEREVLFEGENSMLGRREENIQKAERHMDALAAQVVPYLDGEITEDEMGLRDDVFYKSSTDAENYLEEIEKQMRANKAVPEWFKNIRRSQELDQNNSPFILAPDGGIDFGEILPIHHLPAAPIRLSEGDAENGYIHINNRHGKEIQKQGFNSIEDFVKFVVDNFTRIQEGSAYENETGGQNQTYLVQLQDKHNNTLFIQLSRDGQYWNVNSAGVFKKNYGNNKKNIWSASEVQNDNSAVVDNGLQSEPNADTGSTSNGTPSDVSKGKDSENLVNTSDNTRLSVIAPQMDAEYLAAVEAGDMETAQRMFLEAAKLAMPNTKVVDENGNPRVVYHGTFYQGNIFNKGFFAKDEDFARDYTLFGKQDERRLVSAFLNIENPRIVDANYSNYDSIDTGREITTTDYLVDETRRDGIHDGLIVKNVDERSLDGNYWTDDYIPFSPSQIKSADPVTYDDAGNVIPLSQRFNPANEDIRFSARTDEQRQALFDKAKAQFGLTNNFNAAGYMLPDGSLLDFSEANDGGDPNKRSQDHREIEGIIMDEGKEYDSRWMYLADFMNEGAIRLLPEYAGINLMKAPTKEQRQKLFDFIYKYNGEVILEIADERLNNVAYVEYDRRTSPSRIFRDIDGYFNEGIVPQQDVRFSIANENQAIFVSNAARAVEGIKMEKATPEQWLKMIEKNGGLKAGEDKWMGLSDWLKASDKKTLTKAEVLDFINEHKIQIEEVHYAEGAEDDAENTYAMIERILQEKFGKYIAEYYEQNSGEDDDLYGGDSYEYAMDKLREEMNDEFPYTIERSNSVVYLTFPYEETDDLQEWADKLGIQFAPQNPINYTRLNYTTDGLENKHEIALTVPTIESWNESDDIHFGDAGDGRAVAWIRFGETRINDESAIETARRAVDEASERERAILDKRGKAESEEEYRSLYPALEEAIKAREEAVWAWSRAKDNAVRKKVLVIDEIQSKRHQEGRERGYKPNLEKEYEQKEAIFLDAQDAYINYLKETYNVSLGTASQSEIESLRVKDAKLQDLWEVMQDANGDLKDVGRRQALQLSDALSIPDAPFDKNWHELAMKRMLRYAAEEGYDVIAWTKGEQQAERYGLSNIVESILAEGDWYDSGSTKQEEKVIRNIVITMKSGGNKYYAFNKDGVLINSEYEGKHLSELVGKELAEKLINAKPYEKISEDGLRIGGEGMKGFYDKMLPAFMNKYGKKWGVKVEDIDLSHLESGLTMHSVPVTEEMKASVMEGQVMFSVRTVNQTAQEFHNDALTDFRRQFNLIQPTAVVDINDRAALAEALGEELSDEKYQLILDGVNNGGRSFYDDDTKRIAIFALEEQRTSAEVSENIFHENTHAIISKNPELLELGQWLWDNAKPGAREKIKSAILEAGYPEWQDANEMLSRYTGAILAIGRAGEVLNMLPADQKKHWEFILKEFGYEPEREDGERIRRYDADSRRAGFFRKMSQQKMSDNGAAEKGTRFSSVGITPEVRDEMDRIAATAIFDGNYMLAPNGQPTKLTADQWAIVRTENFKRWFGDWINDPENASKVVDENGEPMVMYHGSRDYGFTVFNTDPKTQNLGSHFGTAEAAKVFDDKGEKTYRVFLNIKKPWVPRYEDFWTNEDQVYAAAVADIANELAKAGNEEAARMYEEIVSEYPMAKDDDALEEWFSQDDRGDTYTGAETLHPKLRRLLEIGNYDGVKYNNWVEDPGNDSWVALNPSQIKSATDNTGEFSESDDIRFSTRFDVNTNPTKAQKKAGNYKMGHLRLDGYNITIENPKGSVRRGTDSKGNEWKNTLNNDYGYIRGTKGVDGDHIDVYLSDNPAEGNVFVIDQVNPETREFDEHKVMYGFNSEEEARNAYLANFSEGWKGLGTITEVTKDEFRKWIDSSHRKTKPFSEYKSVKTDILDEGDIRYSLVTDPALLERLESEPTIKVYRAMQLIDGKLYPPMSAKVDGKMREPIKLGKWEQAEERPDLADEKGYFKLDKGNKTSLKARYNPYFHTSPTPLNDQFASAQARPELVTVEVEVPESELTSGYKADKAKDSVGKMEWKAGVVQSKLSGTRTVILSRWDKPVRIVPDSEVADVIVKMFEGKDITMPSNVVTPSLRAELEKRGVPFVETDNSGKPTKEDVRFSVVATPTDKVVAEGMQLSLQDFAQLAGNIFQDMPESFRKEAIEETFRNGMDMQSAIFQIPARLAEKTEWTDEDKNLARIIREKVQDAVDESGAVSDRPLTTKEALWMLYRSTAANGSDLISAARRSLVAHNLGFDPRSERIREMADDHIRYSVVRNNMIDSATDMYNYEASLWTSRLKESWLDMNQSVISLQNALAEASGKPIESWEDVVLALNQLSSKSYADKKKYMRDFLEPLWDVVLKITKATDYRIEDIERYMMLKHALERNLAFAKRDAREYYETAFRQSIAAIEGNESLSDADKQKQIDKAQKTLDKHLTDIDAGTDAKFLEFREKDYGGLTSMFTDFDRSAVGKRSSYKSEESYQQAVIAATRPRYDNVADMEDAAKDEVDVMENDLAGLAAELWDKINAATKEVLRHQHASGMITTEQYNAVRNMFQHYVPLRGFADNTAEDMYSYYMNNSSNGFAMPIIGAKGRKTKAESPLGWIGTMAESAIQADNKNDAKLRLYYALLNRPDTGVLSIAETWYEYTGQNDANGRKIFAPVYPPATGKAMTADELRQHMDTWESSMMQKQAAGNAFKGNQSVNLRGSVVFQDTKEDKEHIIRVKVAGKDYSILVNGNPRAAQAINGLLNPDANVGPVGEWIGSLRRNMSALMTSFSPLFWVSNYQRDLLSSFMRTSESEGWKQAFKYLNNRRKAWRVASYIYKYDNGTLGNSYYENLYKEFAENGGITGYTSLTTNKEYEKLLEDYAQFADKPIRKWIKNAWNNFMGFGEAIEQVSRFAAFITAREAGKSIEEAVNAAKEVSVNFNRKGSAKPLSLDEIDKLKTKDGKPLNMAQKAVAIVLTAMPKGMKELYFFFNASIQALSSSAKLAKQSPGKATAWAGMYMGLSMALAAINYLISGDDDEEEYLDLPDYVRRSNALVKISDEYYLKWSLPQEMRPFYATADIILGKAAGNMPHKNVGKEVALAMAEWIPVNPFGTDDPLLSLVPDFAAPLAEIKANKNFVGGKIYDDMAFKSEGEKENIPAFRKATSKTGKVYVDVAEVLNAISGGDEVQKGAININPAVVEHLVEGYGGGLYDFAKMMVSFPAMLLSDEDLEVRDIPFVNKVIMSVDETNMYTHTNEVFYHYRDIAENAERVEKEYRNSDDPSRADAYRQEEDWRIHLLFEQYDAELKESKDKLKNAADKEEEDLLKQSQNAVRELLLNDIATGKEPDPVLALNDAIKEISKEISAIKKPFNDAEKKRKKAKESGDMEGAPKAKKERDDIRKSDAYKTADKAGKDLKELRDLLDKIKSTSLPEDRDSLIAKFNDDYQALKKKLESK